MLVVSFSFFWMEELDFSFCPTAHLMRNKLYIFLLLVNWFFSSLKSYDFFFFLFVCLLLAGFWAFQRYQFSSEDYIGNENIYWFVYWSNSIHCSCRCFARLWLNEGYVVDCNTRILSYQKLPMSISLHLPYCFKLHAFHFNIAKFNILSIKWWRRDKSDFFHLPMSSMMVM